MDWWLRGIRAAVHALPGLERLAAEVSQASALRYRRLDPDGDYVLLTGMLPSGAFERRVSYRCAAGQPERFTPTLGFLPDWLGLLWGLARPGGGGIAASVEEHPGRESPLDAGTLDHWVESGGGYFYGEAAASIALPAHTLWPLQSSRFGDLFWVCRDQGVWLLHRETLGFVRIGVLTDLLDMCLDAFLDDRDWFVDGYERGAEGWRLRRVPLA